MTTSKLVLALLLSSFAAVSFAQTPSTDAPASAAHHGKKMHHKHAMGAASGASSSMK